MTTTKKYSPETLRTWVRRTEIDTGRRGGVTSGERARMKELERENRGLARVAIAEKRPGSRRAGVGGLVQQPVAA